MTQARVFRGESKTLYSIILSAMTKRSFLRWLPAVVMMVVIFVASNTPARLIPSFGPEDVIIRKAGHMTGYGLLAVSYWYGMHLNKKLGWLAFLLAVLYAITDEFHQSFVPSRHPSWVDVLVFDAGGAIIGLFLSAWRQARKKIINSE
jgi:VanZ family protein